MKVGNQAMLKLHKGYSILIFLRITKNLTQQYVDPSRLSKRQFGLPTNLKYQMTEGSILFSPQLSLSQLRTHPKIRLGAFILNNLPQQLQIVILISTNCLRLIACTINVQSGKIKAQQYSTVYGRPVMDLSRTGGTISRTLTMRLSWSKPTRLA